MSPLQRRSHRPPPAVHHTHTHTHTHAHTRLTAICPELPGSAGTRKVKPVWILLKQKTVSGSGISWAICKSAPRSRQITTSAPHHSVFLQAGCPSCRPTNSVKALKALLGQTMQYWHINWIRTRIPTRIWTLTLTLTLNLTLILTLTSTRIS